LRLLLNRDCYESIFIGCKFSFCFIYVICFNCAILMKDSIKINTPDCCVCDSMETALFLSINSQDYWRCENCSATFLDPKHYLLPQKEHARYLEHNNDPADKGYRRFLSKLVNPLLQKLDSGLDGLDYGCGPGPVLAQMLCESGLNVELFDPFFFNDQTLLERKYDFITCTETIEHFNHPAKEFARFQKMLRPGGWLALMTCFQTDDASFSSWHYRRDQTHVVFYRESTLKHIAQSLGWSCEIPCKDVALMKKPLK